MVRYYSYTVPIRVTNFNNVCAFQFDVVFNNANLYLETAPIYSFSGGIQSSTDVNTANTNGRLVIAWISGSPLNYGTGDLISLKFNVNSNATIGSDSLEFANGIVADVNSISLNPQFYGSPINITPYGTVVGGIFAGTNTLIIKFQPSINITGAFTSGNFGIRWLTSLGAGVTLSGETGSFGYNHQGVKATSDSYDYITYASTTSIASTTYTAGTEYTLMTVTVSGGTGTGAFELCPSGFAGDAGQWSITLGGSDKAPAPASWYYKNSVGSVLLPVEITSLTVAAQGVNSTIIKWSTATEVNNNGFDVERRAEGSTAWVKVGFVAGAGICNSPREYSYKDANLAPGVYDYRLRQIDNDGSFKYSASAEVNVGVAGKVLGLMNYPNPFNPTTQIEFSLPEDGYASLKVYNMLGQQVATLFSGVAKTGHYIPAVFNASKLASGVYLARLEYNGRSMIQRMLLAK